MKLSNAVDMLLKANSQRQMRDGRKIIITVAVSTDVTRYQHQHQMERSSEVVIGSFRVLSSTDWSTLDAEIRRIFVVCHHNLDFYNCIYVYFIICFCCIHNAVFRGVIIK